MSTGCNSGQMIKNVALFLGGGGSAGRCQAAQGQRGGVRRERPPLTPSRRHTRSGSRSGGRSIVPSTRIRWLIRKGDPLPKRGREVFKAAKQLRAGGNGALLFKLYEGEIEDCATDNSFVGSLKVRGSELETGTIRLGDDLVCEYEVSDSGRVSFAVSVPSVGSTFVSRNIYSRQEGQMDFTQCQPAIQAEAEVTLQKIQQIELRVQDRDLEHARRLLDNAHSACENPAADTEALKEASQSVQRARAALSTVRRQHLPKIREAELDSAVQVFNELAREHAKQGGGNRLRLNDANCRAAGKRFLRRI